MNAVVCVAEAVETARGFFKSTDWTAVLGRDSKIPLGCIHNFDSLFSNFSANTLTIIQNETNVEQRRDVKSADHQADLRPRGVTNPQQLETRKCGPEILSLFAKHWIVAEISDQPWPTLKFRSDTLKYVRVYVAAPVAQSTGSRARC